MKNFLKFLRECFSEQDGLGSYGRFIGFITVLAPIAWVTYIVIKTNALPDLSGAVSFLGIGAGSHYGVNKVVEMLQKKKDEPKTEDPNAVH